MSDDGCIKDFWGAYKDKHMICLTAEDVQIIGNSIKEKDQEIASLREELRPYKENVKLLGDSLDRRVKEIADLKAENNALWDELKVWCSTPTRWNTAQRNVRSKLEVITSNTNETAGKEGSE